MATAIPRFGIALLALALAWQVIHVDAGLYEASGRPRLVKEAPADELDREALLGVLRDNPTEVAALLVLARSYEADSSFEAARQAFAAALELAPIDRDVLSAAGEFFLRRGDTARGFALLATLVDNYPELRAKLFPALADILASRREVQAWNAVMRRNPAWLGAFIEAACNYAGLDPALLVALLLERAASVRQASPEAACVIDRLRGAQRWDEAYLVWLNTLPRDRLADVGFVFNGGFEFAPSGFGFDWIPAKSPEREVGHSVELARTTGAVGNRALRVSYNGKRQGGIPIAQFLALPPGRYELSGRVRADSLKSVRGAHWTLRCASPPGKHPPLGASERFIGSSEWRRFGFDVAVPASCRGQVLQLEPVGADEGVTYLAGTLWFDDLVLRRRSGAN